MSFIRIDERLLNTTVNVLRKTRAYSDVGDVDDEGEATIYAGLKANLQPGIPSSRSIDVESEQLEQGTVRFQTYVAYMNAYVSGTQIDVRTDDLILDNRTGRRHQVVGVDHLISSRVTAPSSHHLMISLYHIGDSRYE